MEVVEPFAGLGSTSPPSSPTVVAPTFEPGPSVGDGYSMPMTQDQWADFFFAAELLEDKDQGYYNRCVDAIHRHWTSIVLSSDPTAHDIAENVINQILGAWSNIPAATELIISRLEKMSFSKTDVNRRLKNRINEIQGKAKKGVGIAQHISEQHAQQRKPIESALEELKKAKDKSETLLSQLKELGSKSPVDITEITKKEADVANLQKSADDHMSSLVRECENAGNAEACQAIPAAKRYDAEVKKNTQKLQRELVSIKQTLRPKREYQLIIPKPREPPIQQPAIMIGTGSERVPQPSVSILSPIGLVSSPVISAPPISIGPPTSAVPSPEKAPSPPPTSAIPLVPVPLTSIEDDLKKAGVQPEDIGIIMNNLMKEEDMWDSFLMAVDILSDVQAIVESIEDETRKNEIINSLYTAMRQQQNTLKDVGERLSQLFNPNENERKDAHTVALALSMLKKERIEKRARATAKHRPRIVADALQMKWGDLKDEYFLTVVDRLSDANIEISDDVARDLTQSVMQKTWETLLPLPEYTGGQMPEIAFGDSDTVIEAKKKLKEKQELKEILKLLEMAETTAETYQ